MNTLPEEIHVDIFGQLGFKVKLRCALACRDWYSKITSTVLYSKIGFKRVQDSYRTRALFNFLYIKGLGHQILDLRGNYIEDPLMSSHLCPNLKSLEVTRWHCKTWDDNKNKSLAQNWRKLAAIKEIDSYYLVTMKLLYGSAYIMSLTSLFIDFSRRNEEKLLIFFKQLKYAPALERLTLKTVSNLICYHLDLIHENTPQLKHLKLESIGPFEGPDISEEYRPLSIGASVSGKLLSFIVEFDVDSYHWNIGYPPWIGYICRKYTNLASIKLDSLNMRQYNRDIVDNNLQKALCNWTQLKKFDIRCIYLSTDILQPLYSVIQ